MAGEVHELKLKVTVDKDTKQLVVLDAELNKVQQSQDQLAKGFDKGSKSSKDFTGRAVGLTNAIKVLLPVFSATIVAKFFIDAAKEAARFDVTSKKALEESQTMWRNLTIEIGKGFTPVIQFIPTLIENIVIGFAKLKRIVEQTTVLLFSLINKNIDYRAEIKKTNDDYEKFLANIRNKELYTTKDVEKAREDLLEKIKKIQLSRFDFDREMLQKEVKELLASNMDKELIEKYRSERMKQINDEQNKAIKDSKKKAEQDITDFMQQQSDLRASNAMSASQILEFIGQDELQKKLAQIESEKLAVLKKNNELVKNDKNYADKSAEIESVANKRKTAAVEEYMVKKMDLEKDATYAVDVLTAESAAQQKEMMWGIVEEEAKAYAKRMIIQAALHAASLNFAGAAIAAAQAAVALGVASYAAGEKKKTREEAEQESIRRDEKIRLEEEEKKRKQDEEEAATQAAAEQAEADENKMKLDYEQGKVSADTYIQFLRRKQSAFKAYSNEWTSIQRDINKLEEERTRNIEDQAAGAADLRGEITGSSVNTEQKTVYNYFTITLSPSFLDISGLDEAYLRDLATKLAGYITQQTTGRG
jgi:hypothetical protein